MEEKIKTLYEAGKTIKEIESILNIVIEIKENVNENVAIHSGDYKYKQILLG